MFEWYLSWCFLGKYMVDRLYVFRGVVGLSPPKKSFMYYQNKLSRYKYMGEKTILLLHLHTYYMPSDRHYWGSSFFASSPVTVCFISFLQFTINHGSLLPCL